MSTTTESALGSLRIGCAGFSNPLWRKEPAKNINPFFEPNLKQAEELQFYSSQFSCTEINTTFHAVPRVETVQSWAQRVSKNRSFQFALKMSKALTHDAGFAAEQQASHWDSFWNVAQHLSEKLGPVLVQLPPWVKLSLPKLQAFGELVPSDVRIAFDVRDKSWHTDEIRQFLKDRNWAFVVHQHPEFESPLEDTASFAYIRMHGPELPLHQTGYSSEQLKAWAQTIHDLRTRGRACYVFFLNDSFAPQNAKLLRKFCAELAGETIDEPLVPKTNTLLSFFGRKNTDSTSKDSVSDTAAAKPPVQNMSFSSLLPVSNSTVSIAPEQPVSAVLKRPRADVISLLDDDDTSETPSKSIKASVKSPLKSPVKSVAASGSKPITSFFKSG